MKRLCTECRERPAKYLYRGKYKAHKHHPLCLQCWRRAMARLASQKLKQKLEEDYCWSQREKE